MTETQLYRIRIAREGREAEYVSLGFGRDAARVSTDAFAAYTASLDTIKATRTRLMRHWGLKAAELVIETVV